MKRKPSPLAIELFKEGIKQIAIAEKSGLSKNTIKEVVWGRQKASMPVRSAIFKLTGWEKAKLDKLLNETYGWHKKIVTEHYYKKIQEGYVPGDCYGQREEAR